MCTDIHSICRNEECSVRFREQIVLCQLARNRDTTCESPSRTVEIENRLLCPKHQSLKQAESDPARHLAFARARLRTERGGFPSPEKKKKLEDETQNRPAGETEAEEEFDFKMDPDKLIEASSPGNAKVGARANEGASGSRRGRPQLKWDSTSEDVDDGEL
ncbi:hypothetical protein MMC25_003331 [Agyrium rufum]|nr:hypothetical protein [Agyrium rufum]